MQISVIVHSYIIDRVKQNLGTHPASMSLKIKYSEIDQNNGRCQLIHNLCCVLVQCFGTNKILQKLSNQTKTLYFIIRIPMCSQR